MIDLNTVHQDLPHCYTSSISHPFVPYTHPIPPERRINGSVKAVKRKSIAHNPLKRHVHIFIIGCDLICKSLCSQLSQEHIPFQYWSMPLLIHDKDLDSQIKNILHYMCILFILVK
jgi:hypothetical protein